MKKNLLIWGLSCCMSMMAVSGWAINKTPDGVYQIATANDLVDFATLVNTGSEVNAKAVLTSDINMAGINYVPIGNSEHKYAGTFDGQGHVINNLVITGNADNQGIFGFVTTSTVKNLVAGPNNSIGGKDYVGGIVAHVVGGTLTITNCGNEGVVAGTGANAAALVGVCENNSGMFIMTNCYNTGTVSGGWESAIITGWHGKDATMVTNFYNSGQLTKGVDGSNVLYRGGMVMTNIYDVNGAQGGTKFTAEQLANGELAYLLNGKSSAEGVGFRQNLSGTVDTHPTIGSSHSVVYANGQLDCAGNPKEGSKIIYSNEDKAVRDAHVWDYQTGLCTVCGNAKLDWMIANADGAFEIGTPAQLNWFAKYADADDAKASSKALIMNDLDMKGVAYFGIGTTVHKFSGSITGKGNVVISNLDMTGKAQQSQVGFINFITAGAVVKNITLDATCKFAGIDRVGGFAGEASGGDGAITFENCGFEGTIDASGANGGGFIGVKTNNNLIPTLTNCYVTGTVNSGREGGSFSGWMPNAVTINCYAIVSGKGMVPGYEFSRGNDIKLTNCYAKNMGSNWNGALTAIEDAWLTDGTLVGKLKGTADVTEWKQGYGVNAHPVFYTRVYASENGDNTFGTATGVNVLLTRSFNDGAWNSIVLPFALSDAQVKAVFGSKVKVADYKNATADKAEGVYTLHFATTANGIKANQPAFIYGAENVDNVLIENVDIIEGAPEQDGGNIDFIGFYAANTLAAGDFFISDDNNLYKAVGTEAIKSLRAIFRAPANSGAKIYTFDIDNATTGISSLKDKAEKEGIFYNLAGQRVDKTYRGVVVSNGKKHINK